MKTNTFIIRAALVLTVLAALSACSFGLDPAWKAKGEGSVAFRFASLDEGGATSSRALVQGSGFLYIRTTGGPTGDKGPFYGPYTVNAGSDFSTTDIPAGSYSGFAVLYSARLLEEDHVFSAWEGVTYTFGQLMRLSDSRFSRLVGGQDETAPNLDEFFNSEVSGRMIENVTVRSSQVNRINITLEPMVSDAYKATINTTSIDPLYLPSVPETTLSRRFVRLSVGGIPSNTQVSAVSVVLSGEGTAKLGKTALYTDRGALISSWSAPANFGSELTFEISTPVTAATKSPYYYLYLEYSGYMTLFPSVSVEPVSGEGVPSVFFAGTPSLAGKQLFYAIFDSDSINAQEGDGNYSAIGLVILDSSGNGASVPYALNTDTNTYEPYSMDPYSEYVVRGFILMSGIYAEISDITGFVQALENNTLETLPSDFEINDDLPPFTTNELGEISFDLLSFSQVDGNLLFIEDGGTGTGLSLGSPASVGAIQSAIANANNNLENLAIVISGTVPLSEPLTIVGNVDFLSNPGNPANIQFTGTLASSFVTVNSYSYLSLIGVRVTGPGTPMDYSGFMVNGSLYLDEGSVIENMNRTGTTSQGGAVYGSGGSMIDLSGGIIRDSSAAYGGAVFLAASGSLYLDAGSITGNQATVEGGGVYASQYSNVSIFGGYITGNHAGTEGGGIFAEYNSSVAAYEGDIGSYVTSNTKGIPAEASNVFQATPPMYNLLFDYDVNGYPYFFWETMPSVSRYDTVRFVMPAGFGPYNIYVNGYAINSIVGNEFAYEFVPEYYYMTSGSYYLNISYLFGGNPFTSEVQFYVVE